MGAKAFSHGHFAHSRNVVENGFRESRSFERKNKEKAKRHSYWTYNAQRKLQRDMRSVQRMFEEVDIEVCEFKAWGSPFDEDVSAYEHGVDEEVDGREAWYDAYGNEYVPEEVWTAEQHGLSYEEELSEGDEESDEEWSAPASVAVASTWFGSAVLYTDPITPPIRTPSPLPRIDDSVLKRFSQPLDFDVDDYDGTISENIDFDNMSEIGEGAWDYKSEWEGLF